MKSLLILLTLISSPLAWGSLPVTGAKADQIIEAFLQLGFDAMNNHDYFQIGTSACQSLYDSHGDYFPNGKIGDYVGERCLIYGESDLNDGDETLRIERLIPREDRELKQHPEIQTLLMKMKSLRESLEVIVQPIIETTTSNNTEIVIRQTVGISGMECEGRDAGGNRICFVKTSSLCPARP